MVEAVNLRVDSSFKSAFGLHLQAADKILVLLVAAGVWVLTGGCTTMPGGSFKQTYSSFDQPYEHPQPDKIAPGTMTFDNVAVTDVLKIYAAVSARTVMSGQIPLCSISVRTLMPLSRIETLQMLDTVLAQNGIAMVLSGDKSVKAVPANQAVLESPPEITLPWRLLPDSSSCMTRTVHLEHCKPSEVVPVLMPFAKLRNSIMPVDGAQMLILRDYSSNIRKELQLLEELEKKQGK